MKYDMTANGEGPAADLAAFNIIEALDQGDDSGLAAAGLANQGQAAAGLHPEAELAEDLHLGAGRVPEAHTAQLHTAATFGHPSPCTTQSKLLQVLDEQQY